MRACGSVTETSSFCIDEKAESVEHIQVKSDKSSVVVKNIYWTPHDSPKSFITGRRFLSSQAGKESSDEEEGDQDLEAVLSDSDEEVDEHSGDEDLIDAEISASEKAASKKPGSFPLFRKIIAGSGVTVGKVINKWVEEGNDVSRVDILQVLYKLRRRRMFSRALQLLDWLELTKKFEFTERDYASRVDLIAKSRGIPAAESYINSTIPKEFKTEVIYRTLLANYVRENKVQKVEKIVNKMNDLGFTISAFTCNQLLLLYKRLDKKKIADVLLLMENKDVKPNIFTYRILINIKGLSNDINGMEQILETMSNQDVEPDLRVYADIARHYISAGLNEKAEVVLKKMEGDNIRENPYAIRHVLPLYASIGKSEDVSRIWNICKSDPKMEECLAAIESFGILKQIEDAEEVFDNMSKSGRKLSTKHYTTILRVYSSKKMLEKGKEIIQKMCDCGCLIGPYAWDALVKLYIDAGELEKADSVLEKARQNRKFKAMFNSYISIMSVYAKRGDVHNAEKMFFWMKQAGYVARSRQYQTLVEAYANAKQPAYGMRDRLKADNIFPNKGMAALLSSVDAFRKKQSMADLIE
jgi:pentatricopeptide repeat protein